ncbi:MAG: hypothetical protein PHE06_07570 [Lachnospiraceae bacterium]|nr:hypothetical protein [Lachnospiraceae bacterium]
MKAILLRKLGKKEEALEWLEENKKIDGFDYVSCFEEILFSEEEERNEKQKRLTAQMRNFHQNFIQAAIDYMESGFYKGNHTALQ